MRKDTVTVVIPAHNEEKTIREIIRRVKPYADDILVVLSKNSKDRTRKIVKSMGIKAIVDNGKGKGDAIRCAIEEIKQGIIVFIDADGSHIPEDIPKLVEPIKKGKADLVIASRITGGSEELSGNIGQVARLFLGSLITLLINIRFKSELTESQNGFRAITHKAAESLNLKADGFDIETEMVMKCLKKGYRVEEAPSRELKRRYGESGINILTTGWRYIWTVFKNIWW